MRHFNSFQGYCSPPEEDDNAAGEGATEFEDIKDGGLGSGEGVKDVSDQIETEDQVNNLFLKIFVIMFIHFFHNRDNVSRFLKKYGNSLIFTTVFFQCNFK